MKTFENILKNHLANFNQTPTKYPWIKGVQLYSNERSHLPPWGKLAKLENKTVEYAKLFQLIEMLLKKTLFINLWRQNVTS